MHSTGKENQIYDNGQDRSNILQLSQQIYTLKTTLPLEALAAGEKTLTEESLLLMEDIERMKLPPPATAQCKNKNVL